MAQTVKNLPAMREIQVRSLGQEDLLENGMATHSSVVAWRIPWTEEPGGLQQSMGSQRVKHNRATFTFTLYRPLSILSTVHTCTHLVLTADYAVLLLCLDILPILKIRRLRRGELRWLVQVP